MTDTAGCQGKIAHATRAAASKAHRSLLSRPGAISAKLETYHCKICGCYHLGRPPSFIRQPVDRAINASRAKRYYGMVKHG